MKSAIILGTRPEIIKMSPIIRECEARRLEYLLIHTGQHYSYEMDSIFFDELELPRPSCNLNVGSGSHADETGRMLIAIEKELLDWKPDVVLVEGDTNSVLAGALAAAKLHIPVAHVEAGMRSYDRNMPEEINRIIADHISDYLLAPTAKAQAVLCAEGIPPEKTFMTGSTIVEAVDQSLQIARKRDESNLSLEPSTYCLATTHREENVDRPDRLADILTGLHRLHEATGLTVILPAHPRTTKNLERFALDIPEGVRIVSPVGFLGFLALEANARIILTDSGGVQMEACILRVPCVTLRDSTEWLETIEVGANVLAGSDPASILSAAMYMLNKDIRWEEPFGDGTATAQTLGILMH